MWWHGSHVDFLSVFQNYACLQVQSQWHWKLDRDHNLKRKVLGVKNVVARWPRGFSFSFSELCMFAGSIPVALEARS